MARITRVVIASVVVAAGPLAPARAAMAAGVTPVVTVGSAAIVEGNTGTRVVRIPVTMNRPGTTTVTVRYRIVGITATAGTIGTPGIDVDDRRGKVLSVAFRPTASGAALVDHDLSVRVAGDTRAEGDETFAIEIVGVTNGTGAIGTQSVSTILDDESVAAPSVGVGDVAIGEGDDGKRVAVVPVSLSDARSVPTTLQYRVVPWTAFGHFTASNTPGRLQPLGTDLADHRSSTLTATIPAGALSKSISIPIYPDPHDEGDEVFLVQLDSVSAGVTPGRTTGVGRILDDDAGAPGAIYSWGWNVGGGLGSVELLQEAAPHHVGLGTDWRMLDAQGSVLAVDATGRLYAWGFDHLPGAPHFEPTHVTAMQGWTAIAAGSNRSFAIRSDGTLWGWGSGIGDGTSTDHTSPTRIGDDTDWAMVATDATQTAAIKTDGSLWTWTSVPLGPFTTPARVGTATNWAQVRAGAEHLAAITTTGHAFTWGANDFGQLGDGTRTARTVTSPADLGGGWAEIAGGQTHTIGRRTDGSLWAWGRNEFGEVGIGTRTDVLTPTAVAAGTTWRSVSAGGAFSAAIRSDGTVWEWGLASQHQTGPCIESLGVADLTPCLRGDAGTASIVRASGVDTLVLRH